VTRRPHSTAEERGARWSAACAKLEGEIEALANTEGPLSPEQTTRLRNLLSVVLRPEPESKS